MPFNPLKTRADWQKIKKQYGIPDRIIKGGSFGEKMEKLQKKFESLGLGKITNANANAALAFVKAAEPLVDEWLTAANKLKPTAFKDRTKAIEKVKDMKKGLNNVRELAEAALNPIGMSKANWKKFDALWVAARRDPKNADKAHTMYNDGIRNYIGQGFHDAYKMKAVLNLAPAVSAKIDQYEKIAARWNHLQSSAQVLADDDQVNAKFWLDMIKAKKLGAEIIQSAG
jgi:hypothetical protein